jgi:hypothetical protein
MAELPPIDVTLKLEPALESLADKLKRFEGRAITPMLVHAIELLMAEQPVPKVPCTVPTCEREATRFRVCHSRDRIVISPRCDFHTGDMQLGLTDAACVKNHYGEETT